METPNETLEGGESVGRGKHFFAKAEEDPCVGCSAPCCRAFFMPYPTPSTYMDLDAMLFTLGFPSTVLILTSDGDWKLMLEGNCRFLDQATNLCTIYSLARRPKTCLYFNPFQCWHKRNFHNNDNPSDLIRIDLGGLEAILENIHFDDDGNITFIPPWEELQELAGNHKRDD